MYSLNSLQDIQRFSLGCDADIGGLSEAYWGHTPENTALFWGNLNTQVPEGMKVERSGYAGIKAKVESRKQMIQTKICAYLEFKGCSNYVISPATLRHMPFRDFILTAYGNVQKRQLEMDRSRIRNVGFSIVRQDGEFSLELDWIKAVNTERTAGDRDIDPRENSAVDDTPQAPLFVDFPDGLLGGYKPKKKK
ncbi:Complex I intermediate-associated protein 30, mitochondrial [Entophlyctis luteolus]|nr:Complex I intermediate-associated protein 30, mitochondrial [Entophlyctis luteolus]